MEVDYPAAHSMDTVWFAVDASGHLGRFTSGENGHVPNAADMENLAEDWWRFRHPGLSDAEVEQQFWHLDGDDLANELGLFVFDYDDEYEPIGTYRRVGVPKEPLHVDQLPPQFRKRWKAVQFDKVDFTQIAAVQPLEFEHCTYWYEDDRVAYLCGDGKTVRPIPGKEDEFADFCAEFRTANPEQALRLIFDGLKPDS